MDDIFAGRSNHIDVAGGSNWNGIRANLAEMERKLGELQQRVDPPRPPATPQPALAPQPTLSDALATPAAQAQVAQVKQQIEDLLRVREMLRDSLRGTIGECERMLGQLDRGESVVL